MIQRVSTYYTASSIENAKTNDVINNSIIFVITAMYGPSVQILGKLSYSELFIIFLYGPWLFAAIKSLDVWQRKLVFLFFISAGAHLVSSAVNASPTDETLKRVGTYVILALLFVVMNHATRDRPQRLLSAIAGLCTSYLLVATFGLESPSAKYLEFPWRLGLGNMVTIFVCLAAVWVPRFRMLTAILLLALTVVDIFKDARSLALLTGATALVGMYATVSGKKYTKNLTSRKVILLCALALLAAGSAYEGAKIATENKLFPESLQRKMEFQFSSRYGLLASARPETASELYAIYHKPIFGYGPGKDNSDVQRVYALVAAYQYRSENREGVVSEAYKRRGHGIPTHSLLLGAWAEAGVFAGICWMLCFGLAAYVIFHSIRWSNKWVYLYIFVSLLVMWDILFSPGPVRLTMAIELLILSHAVRSIRDAKRFDAVSDNTDALS